MVAGYFTTEGARKRRSRRTIYSSLAKGDGGGVSNPPATAALPPLHLLPLLPSPLASPRLAPSPKRTPKSRFAVGCGDNG